MLRAFLLVVPILLLGCSAPNEKPSNHTAKPPIPDFPSIKTDQVFVYGCGDSLQFTAYVQKDSTWLFLPDTSLKVTKVRSGSGAKYQSSHYIYWSKGNEALFQMPKGALLNCTSIPQERSWAAAKLRGVDFRAIGQEPGWYLEITQGEQIEYVGNYGEDSLSAPAPKRTVNAGGQRHYRVETKSRTLSIEITDEPCTDNMSGFAFPSTVSVTVDGKTHHGCGRALE